MFTFHTKETEKRSFWGNLYSAI